MPTKRSAFTKDSSAIIGFEAKLWLAADIRRALIEADLVDCMVAVHAQFFTIK